MPDDTERVSVDPPIHVEQYQGHRSLSWRVPDFGDLLAAVRAAADVSPRASTVVDATDTGGRRRVPLRAVDPDPTITYVRVEPAMAWRLAWQRRTENVAVLTGTPASATVRELHRATGGTGWDHAERTALDRLLSE
ncbi:hypothetical protein DU504_15625 [Haloplanus salinus]|jgi:hypothetical protein|uniref:Uncharacterized protein n=1 Tax=Haloplanus salinus TaxID=1126245 RepID=A0A368N2C3_9EURY|nr:hypothetical protein [Haloplanus salinus]RCU44223.1 hypothetical protein DU504_15625 [Haloplanus salinus]